MIISISAPVVGPDIQGPLKAHGRVRPEMAALNAGSLNYLKTRSGGKWAAADGLRQLGREDLVSQ
ncbi:MAG: hypothetical protein R3F43_22435 [bacterium]